MVGCNYLYAFAPNLRSRESRRRRHVARVVRDAGDWAGYELFQRPTLNPRQRRSPERVGETSNLEHRTLPCIFYLALALGFLAKGPIAWTPLLTVAVLIIYTRDWQMLRRFKFAVGVALMLVSGRALGNPGADSNTWGVFQSGNWTTRRQPFVYDTGRSRREFLRHVRAAIAVLFCHGLHQFLSVVDQVAVVNSQIVAEERKPGSTPPATAEFRSILICSRASRSSSSSLLWSARSYRTTRCRRFRCLRFCSRGIGTKERLALESRRSLFSNHRGRNCVCVDRSCPRGSANGGAVFPRVSALSGVSRVFAAEHAICCGRVPGAKSGLVFSLPRPRFSHAAEQASRC